MANCMEYLRLEIDSNDDVWELVDKSIQFNLVHHFNPHEIIEWWQTDIKAKNGSVLKDLVVRDLRFDLLTNIPGLKDILDLNTQQFDIFQFSRTVSDTLRIQDLPESSKYNILQDNGLVNAFECRFEVLEISTTNAELVSRICEHDKFGKRILGRTTVRNKS